MKKQKKSSNGLLIVGLAVFGAFLLINNSANAEDKGKEKDPLPPDGSEKDTLPPLPPDDGGRELIVDPDVKPSPAPSPEPKPAPTPEPTNYVELEHKELYKKYATKFSIHDWRWLRGIAGVQTNYGQSTNYKNKQSYDYGKKGLHGLDYKAFEAIRKLLGRSDTHNDLWNPEIDILYSSFFFATNYKQMEKSFEAPLERTVICFKYPASEVLNGSHFYDSRYFRESWKNEFMKVLKVDTGA